MSDIDAIMDGQAPVPGYDFRVNPEYRDLIFPPTVDEITLLRSSLLSDGCRHALVFGPSGYLLDGHNRLRICLEDSIAFTVGEVNGLANQNAERLWIVRNQIGRRNLSKSQLSMLVTDAEPLIEAEKQAAKDRMTSGANQYSPPEKVPEGSKGDARDIIGREFGVSGPLVDRARAVVKYGDKENIKANFDFDSLGTLQGAEYPRNGKTRLWIFDGQHRLKALMELDLGDWVCDVLVHLTIKDDKAAALQFLQIGNTKNLNNYEKFRQEIISENDIAIGVTEILERRDIKATQTQTDGGVCCVATLKRLFVIDEGETLGETLDTATAAWGRTAGALDGKLLDGIGRVLRAVNGNIDREKFVVKLAKFPGGAPGVIGKARIFRDLNKVSMTKSVSAIVVGAYNTGRRTGRIEV